MSSMAADGGSNDTNQYGPARRAYGPTPEFIAAHSARHKGKIVSEETRKKQAAAKLGLKQSPETIAKRAATLKAIWEKKNGDKHTN